MSPIEPVLLDIKVGTYSYSLRPSIFQKVEDGLLARIFAPSKTALLRSTKLNLERNRGDLFKYIISWFEKEGMEGVDEDELKVRVLRYVERSDGAAGASSSFVTSEPF